MDFLKLIVRQMNFDFSASKIASIGHKLINENEEYMKITIMTVPYSPV